MATAIVRYDAGQTDDEGNPVGTEPFAVVYDPSEGDNIYEAIAETGRVQFDWILVGEAR